MAECLDTVGACCIKPSISPFPEPTLKKTMADNVQGSLSAYGAIIALLPAFLALGLTERGGGFLRGASRKARTTVRPIDGTCERRLWSDLPWGLLHVCRSQFPTRCHQKPHVSEAQCWQQTLCSVINTWSEGALSIFETKPAVLPISKLFVRADFEVIFAFILMTDDIELGIQVITPQVLVIHSRSNLKRPLKKEHVERILSGYPPLIADPTGTSVLKTSDERRGGAG